MGIVITAMSALILVFALAGPFGGGLWLLAPGLVFVTGIGLLLDARFARVLAGLLFLAGVVFSPLSLIRSLTGVLGGWDLLAVASIANAIATTLLITWLCARAVLVLLGKARDANAATVRLVGGALIVIAANHLCAAARLGYDSLGAWSLRVAPEGTQLIGFPGWPLWHVAMLVVALILLVGPRHLLSKAAAVLTLLVVCLVPLAVAGAVRSGAFEPPLLIFLVGVPLILAYVCWWLTDELRSGARLPL